MAMRWNQHRRHGRKPATSENHSEPSVAVRATAKASGSADRATSGRTPAHQRPAAGDRRAATEPASTATVPAAASTASRAKKSPIVSGSTRPAASTVATVPWAGGRAGGAGGGQPLPVMSPTPEEPRRRPPVTSSRWARPSSRSSAL